MVRSCRESRKEGEMMAAPTTSNAFEFLPEINNVVSIGVGEVMEILTIVCSVGFFHIDI